MLTRCPDVGAGTGDLPFPDPHDLVLRRLDPQSPGSSTLRHSFSERE